jgi:hypothetical protein
MIRAGWGVCAIVLMVVGCDFSGNFLAVMPCKSCSSWGKPQGDRVVAANLDEVSQSTQDSLKSLGLVATATKQGGDDIRIRGESKTGARFSFVLHRVKGPNGESTRVRLEWDKPEEAKNHASIVQVLADLELNNRKG